jgi:hypothetical protein
MADQAESPLSKLKFVTVAYHAPVDSASRRFTFQQTTTRGTERTERNYTITYLDDPPERREAVAFLGAKAAHDKTMYRRLRPEFPHLPELDAMSPEAAQNYLDSHPMQRRWQFLNIDHRDLIFDDDLARLQYVPEITSVHILSSRITNRGIGHLCHLTHLKNLILYSRRLTNACLKDIVRLKSLEILDLQMSPWVSRSAFLAAAAKLPLLTESFAPRRWPLTAIVRWFYVEWRRQRQQRQVLPAG